MCKNGHCTNEQEEGAEADSATGSVDKPSGILSCLCWICRRHRQCVFLIPYFICLFLAALPLFYVEMALGQFSSLGPGSVFRHIAPVSAGIGWGMIVICFFTTIYYNMLIAYCLIYLIMSIRTSLPWSTCSTDWATSECWSNMDSEKCTNDFGSGYEYFNKSCWNQTDYSELVKLGYTNGTRISPSEQFWERYVLNLSEQGFDEMGCVQWKLVAALGGAWLLIFCCTFRGLKSTGKIVYFTAIFPYVVLIVMLIRGVTLEGAGRGIRFYISPNMSKLAEISVWKDAAVQIFYSLGPAFGVVISMASYSRFNNNCYRDAVLVGLINSASSFVAGFAVFSIAGFLADQQKVPIEKVVRDGIGLAFIAYPEALSRLPAAPLWSVMFFLMLILLGMDSQFAFYDTLQTALLDSWPHLRRKKAMVTALVMTGLFLSGLVMCSRSGLFVFILMNDYCAGYCLIILALCEALVIGIFYGIEKLFQDVRLMTGSGRARPGPVPALFSALFSATGYFMRFSIMLFCPLLLSCILLASFVYYKVSTYGTYTFPIGAETVGWIMSAASVIMLPIFALSHIWKIYRKNRPLRELWTPTKYWTPVAKRSHMLQYCTVDAAMLDRIQTVSANIASNETANTA